MLSPCCFSRLVVVVVAWQPGFPVLRGQKSVYMSKDCVRPNFMHATCTAPHPLHKVSSKVRLRIYRPPSENKHVVSDIILTMKSWR